MLADQTVHLVIVATTTHAAEILQQVATQNLRSKATVVKTREALRAALQTGAIDAIVAEDGLDDCSSFDVLAAVREAERRPPLLILSGSAAEQREALDAMGQVLAARRLRRASADITLMRNQLHTERSQFEAIMKQFPAGIMIAEAPSGRIAFCNDQAQALLGTPTSTAVGLSNYSDMGVCSADGQPLALEDWPLTRALQRGEVVKGQVIKIQSPSKSEARYLSLNAAPLFNSDGDVTSAVLALFDITAERMAQLSFVQAKEDAERANHAKSAFLAHMSHEIRTPLGAIIGFTELLRTEPQSEHEQDETLAIIERNGYDLMRLIDEILDLSKIEAQKIEIEKIECSISNVMRDVMSLLGHRAREKGLSITVSTEPDTPDLITSDPARLKQILINIMGNAIKFTERGGIEVAIGKGSELTPQRTPIRFSIRDTGIGIHHEHRQRLFQPFSQVDGTTTRKFGGTGLGLLLSRKLAQLLGGDVVLSQSEPGLGSCFEVTVNGAPARIGERASSSVELSANAGIPRTGNGLKDLSILAADDCIDNQLLLKRVLTRLGARVDLVSNGHEAVERAAAQTYDLVLMDLQMPECDGYNATRRLRSLGFTKPILALSAHARDEEQEQSFQAGCNAHITKPIDMGSLLLAIVHHTEQGAKEQPRS